MTKACNLARYERKLSELREQHHIEMSVLELNLTQTHSMQLNQVKTKVTAELQVRLYQHYTAVGLLVPTHQSQKTVCKCHCTATELKLGSLQSDLQNFDASPTKITCNFLYI